jgi:uncharacterized membrane protein
MDIWFRFVLKKLLNTNNGGDFTYGLNKVPLIIFYDIRIVYFCFAK